MEAAPLVHSRSLSPYKMSYNLHNICDGKHPGREARRGFYTYDQCLLCWRKLMNWPDEVGPLLPLESKMPSSTPPLPSPPFPRGRYCRHLGDATGEVQECPSCEGKVLLKLFACALHEKCTPQR